MYTIIIFKKNAFRSLKYLKNIKLFVCTHIHLHIWCMCLLYWFAYNVIFVWWKQSYRLTTMKSLKNIYYRALFSCLSGLFRCFFFHLRYFRIGFILAIGAAEHTYMVKLFLTFSSIYFKYFCLMKSSVQRIKLYYFLITKLLKFILIYSGVKEIKCAWSFIFRSKKKHKLYSV